MSCPYKIERAAAGENRPSQRTSKRGGTEVPAVKITYVGGECKTKGETRGKEANAGA